MRVQFIATFVSLLVVFPALAQDKATLSPQELAQRAVQGRAVEAVIWGMPAVNYDRMLQAAIATGAKANQVVYWSRPVNWKRLNL
jgi:hypothetical protein